MHRNAYDTHHTLWQRRDYQRATVPYLFREHNAMKHKIPVIDHRDLHADLSPINRMSTELARMSLQYLVDNFKPNDTRMDAFDGVIEYYEKIRKGVGRLAVESGLFSEHLSEQRLYFGRTERQHL